jgi:ferredoxin
MTKYGIPSMAPSGYVSQLNRNLCTGCGICVDSCPFKALSLDKLTDKLTIVIDWQKCMGCGVCVSKCPNQALSLVRDERKGIPLDVRMLAQEESSRDQR